MYYSIFEIIFHIFSGMDQSAESRALSLEVNRTGVRRHSMSEFRRDWKAAI